jgi:hypothetical protein
MEIQYHKIFIFLYYSSNFNYFCSSIIIFSRYYQMFFTSFLFLTIFIFVLLRFFSKHLSFSNLLDSKLIVIEKYHRMRIFYYEISVKYWLYPLFLRIGNVYRQFLISYFYFDYYYINGYFLKRRGSLSQQNRMNINIF